MLGQRQEHISESESDHQLFLDPSSEANSADPSNMRGATGDMLLTTLSIFRLNLGFRSLPPALVIGIPLDRTL